VPWGRAALLFSVGLFSWTIVEYFLHRIVFHAPGLVGAEHRRHHAEPRQPDYVAAPALMAGNVGVLKHAANVPRSGLEIEALFRAAGFPDGVFTTLLVSHGRVADLIRDDRIAAVTLTGSEAAGRKVAEMWPGAR
jgi:hypothetical protein